MIPKHLEPAYPENVGAVLKIVRAGLNPRPDGSPGAAAARAALPATKPHARMFMAWEVYYKNPNARRDALVAITEFTKVAI